MEGFPFALKPQGCSFDLLKEHAQALFTIFHCTERLFTVNTDKAIYSAEARHLNVGGKMAAHGQTPGD